MPNLGSYFSPQGATIKQAIGALGEYLDAGDGGTAPPWAGAFDDGSFGHGRSYTGRGESQAFQDGSLGAFAGLGAKLFMAEQDLGQYGNRLRDLCEQFFHACGLGPRQSNPNHVPDAALQAFRSGVQRARMLSPSSASVGASGRGQTAGLSWEACRSAALSNFASNYWLSLGAMQYHRSAADIVRMMDSVANGFLGTIQQCDAVARTAAPRTTLARAMYGLGEYLDAGDGGRALPWAGAYQDGSFAHGRDNCNALGEFLDAASMPRTVAYDDGTLGSPRGDVWTSSEGGGEPGPLQSYVDGSLGRGYGGVRSSDPAARYDGDAGSLTAGAGGGAGGSDEAGSVLGPVYAYKDGVLGAMGEYYEATPGLLSPPLSVDGRRLDTPTAIGRWGQSGPGYGRPGVGTRTHAWRDGSLGAVPDPKVVDLQNLDALKETRAAIALFVPEVAMANGGAGDSAFVESPIWTDKDDLLWGAAITKLIMRAPTYKEGDLSQSSSGHHYPTPLGLSVILAVGVAAPTGPQGPAWFSSTFPILSAFLAAVTANGGKTSGFKVTAPFFSQTELVRGGKSTFAGFSSTTLAVAGLGIAAAVAAAFAMKKRKRA